jgi:hypothetical protein
MVRSEPLKVKALSSKYFKKEKEGLPSSNTKMKTMPVFSIHH